MPQIACAAANRMPQIGKTELPPCGRREGLEIPDQEPWVHDDGHMASAFGYVPFQMLVPVVLLGLVTAVAVATPALLRGDPCSALLRVSRVLLGGALLAILAVTLSGGAERVST